MATSINTASFTVQVDSPVLASTLRREFAGLLKVTLTCDLDEARRLYKLLLKEGLTDDANRVKNNAHRYLLKWNRTRWGRTVKYQGRSHQYTVRKSKQKDLDGKYLVKFEIGEIIRGPLPMNFIRGSNTVGCSTKASQDTLARRWYDEWETQARLCIADQKAKVAKASK